MLDQLNIQESDEPDSYLMPYIKNQFRLNCRPKWKNKIIFPEKIIEEYLLLTLG